MYETQTLSFVSDESNKIFTPEKISVEINNPIDQTNKYLRTNLYTSLLETYKFNLEQNNQSKMFFEINNIFDMGDHLKYDLIPNQIYTLSGIVPKEVTNADRRNDSTVNDIYYVKQLLVSILGECSLQQIEKPGFHKNISYLVIKDDIILGHFGQLSIEMQDNYELDKPVYLFSIDLTNVDKDHLVQVNYKPLSPYPFVKFDLSFIVNPSFNAQDLINEVEHILSENENILTIFDDFKNEKTRNLGIRISTRSYTKTYSEDEVSDVLNQIVETVEAKFSIKLNKGK